jgi:hypothetical protein
MRKWFSLFLLFAMLMIPARADAQATVGFDTLDVSVWPEFDTPTVLVIYKIGLAPKTSLPVEVTLRLPPSVAKTAVVAVGSAIETVSDQNVDYTFTQGAEFSTVTIKATALFIQVEYYDPSLIKTGNQRTYTYEWLGDYSVDKFRFELQKPLKSSNLTTTPVLQSKGVDNNGFEFSDLAQASIKVGQKMTFDIQYQRETDAPSTSFLQVQPSAPLDPGVSGQSNWSTYLPWILGGVGLILLLIAGGVYWVSGSANRTMVRSRKRHTVRKDGDSDAGKDGEPGGDAAHCSQCGKRAQPSDRFCRVCGSRIRRDEA